MGIRFRLDNVPDSFLVLGHDQLRGYQKTNSIVWQLKNMLIVRECKRIKSANSQGCLPLIWTFFKFQRSRPSSVMLLLGIPLPSGKESPNTARLNSLSAMRVAPVSGEVDERCFGARQQNIAMATATAMFCWPWHVNMPGKVGLACLTIKFRFSKTTPKLKPCGPIPCQAATSSYIRRSVPLPRFHSACWR